MFLKLGIWFLMFCEHLNSNTWIQDLILCWTCDQGKCTDVNVKLVMENSMKIEIFWFFNTFNFFTSIFTIFITFIPCGGKRYFAQLRRTSHITALIYSVCCLIMKDAYFHYSFGKQYKLENWPPRVKHLVSAGGEGGWEGLGTNFQLLMLKSQSPLHLGMVSIKLHSKLSKPKSKVKFPISGGGGSVNIQLHSKLSKPKSKAKFPYFWGRRGWWISNFILNFQNPSPNLNFLFRGGGGEYVNIQLHSKT